MDQGGNPVQAALSTTGMRKLRPLLLTLPIMLAAWIWAGLTLGAEPDAELPQGPSVPELRVRRTGVETLAPRPPREPPLRAQPIEPLEPMPPHVARESFHLPGFGLTLIEGEVLDEQGQAVDAMVFSTECPSQAFTEDGHFELYFFTHDPRECDVQASTQHGMLNAISETQWVEIAPGDEPWVTLYVDAQPQGGLGVAFELNGAGAQITWVHPGGPGMRGGLQVGDVIQEVDGHDFREVFDPHAFVQTTIGPVGTEVSLLLEGESQIRTFVRGHISEDTATSDKGDAGLAPIDEVDLPLQDTGWQPAWDTGWLDTGVFAPEGESF